MIDYMITGPVFCMVWAGKGAVKTGRKMLGETNPADSLPGSIAATSASTSGAVASADTVENAESEIAVSGLDGRRTGSGIVRQARQGLRAVILPPRDPVLTPSPRCKRRHASGKTVEEGGGRKEERCPEEHAVAGASSDAARAEMAVNGGRRRRGLRRPIACSRSVVAKILSRPPQALTTEAHVHEGMPLLARFGSRSSSTHRPRRTDCSRRRRWSVARPRRARCVCPPVWKSKSELGCLGPTRWGGRWRRPRSWRLFWSHVMRSPQVADGASELAAAVPRMVAPQTLAWTPMAQAGQAKEDEILPLLPARGRMIVCDVLTARLLLAQRGSPGAERVVLCASTAARRSRGRERSVAVLTDAGRC